MNLILLTSFLKFHLKVPLLQLDIEICFLDTVKVNTISTSGNNHHVITREKLGELIELCGGKLITKLWECDPQDTYIIFATESKEYDVARRYEFDTKVPVLNADWILDSVAEFRTISPFDKYRVFSTTANQAVKY